MFTLKDLQNKVEKGISDYIGFDVREIFNQSDYITIYGGSVRDSLAELDIHDIDILCMSESAKKLRDFIVDEKNYQPLDLYDADALNMYKGISMIEEPWTFMNDNKKIIQIIRPRYAGYTTKVKNDLNHITKYQLAYYELIKNVDLSCCGVFLENNGEIKLKEACKSAIIHCLSKTFKIQEWSKLYNKDRTMTRERKLTERGWDNLSEPSFNMYIDKGYYIKKTRKLKLIELEFKPEYDFKIWKEQEYLNNEKNFNSIQSKQI